jgi:hypothetical protein
LVIIDEAGLADTLSLDTAVQFVIGRGGGVRLVGDDQLAHDYVVLDAVSQLGQANSGSPPRSWLS